MKRLLFRNYWIGSSLKYWLGRRLTKAGMLVIAGLFLTLGLAFDTEQSLAYQTFALLLCLTAVSFVAAIFFRGRFSVIRHLPRFGSVGVPFRYRIEIHNRGRKTQRGLTLLEELEDPRVTTQKYLLEISLTRKGKPLRLFGSQRRVKFATFEEAVVPPLPPNGEGIAETNITPLRRGVLRFRRVVVARTDPFGLFRAFIRIPLSQTVAILPKRYPVSPMALPGTLKYQHGGMAMASSVGESEEFVSVRDYRRGDPLRHIHWKSWAKAGRPIVKQFEDEFFVRHGLVLDTFGSAVEEDVFEEAVSVAASFACTIQNQESLLDLMFAGTEAFSFTSGRGLGHTEQVLEILAGVQLSRAGQFETLQQLVMEHAGLLSGCICVFLDWDSRRKQLVEHLRVLGIPVLVLVIVKTGNASKLGEPQNDGSFMVLETDKIREGLQKL
ncbi:MAG TPA: DUF58 domain-containing protein [Candidatus Saccharimonadales bacterium]|nr:DUF58 domain-containing protein [Candidatus Saccharimonadales bacterium]